MSTATDILGKIGEKVGTEIKGVKDVLTAHTSDQNNPHGVSASQVGLGNVENTALSSFAGSSNITTLGTIASGSIPYNLITNAPNPNQIDGDLNITGNLQVNGTRTILQTQTLEVEDNIIELNLQSDGSETAQTAGIEINRGTNTSSVTADTGFTGTLTFNQAYGGSSYGEFAGTYTATGYQIYSNNNTFRLARLANGTNDVVASNDSDIMNTLNDGWAITNVVKTDGVVTSFELGFTETISATEDKAKIIWDDNTSKFRLRVGNGAADLVVDKIYNNNMFLTIASLPSASKQHGMMVHVHETGQSYFAHNGNWVELISVSGGQTIAGTIAATSFLAPNKDGVKINNVSLGDYATFETALTTAMA